MKTLSRICLVAAVAVSVASCKPQQEADPQAATPQEVAEQLGFAWNLGNHFDSKFAEGVTKDNAWYWDGATPTQELYANLKQVGVKTVRIPVTWGPWESAAPEYTIDPYYIDLVKTNVLWAKEAGLNVILNLHHDEYWLDIYNATYSDSVNASIMQRIERTWAQVAEAFKEEGNYLFLETFNEIHAKTDSMEDWSGAWCRSENGRPAEIVNSWNELAVRTIRATGSVNATRWIVLNGYCANPGMTMDYLTLPEDEAGRLMVSVHSYSPCDFTLEDKTESWGEGENKERDEQEIIDLFTALKEKYTDQGIPCYMGEFGCDEHATAEGEACRLRYLEMYGKEAKKALVAPVLWDNGNPGAGAEHHAYFDHNNGAFANSNAEAVIRALVEAVK